MFYFNHLSAHARILSAYAKGTCKVRRHPSLLLSDRARIGSSRRLGLASTLSVVPRAAPGPTGALRGASAAFVNMTSQTEHQAPASVVAACVRPARPASGVVVDAPG